jgi:hypothetical protein
MPGATSWRYLKIFTMALGFQGQIYPSMPYIDLLPQDIDRYKELKNGQQQLLAALKLSKKRGLGDVL